MLVLIQHTAMLMFKWFSFIFCYEFKISNSQNQLLSLQSFRAQREIFLALCSFLFPSQMDSPFPLSHIRRYTGVPERSLHFGRDDVAEAAFSQHIRWTLREINPFPHTVISNTARNLPCTLFFLASFAEGFPFPAVAHMALYRCAKKIPRLRSG